MVLMATKTKIRSRQKVKRNPASAQADGVYLLKLVLYAILGTQWLWFTTQAGTRIPLPVGFILGVAFALHDHFQIDRKVEYGILIAATLIGYLAHVGVVVS